MTIYTVGYLGKMQYESIEGMNSAPLEAANAMGLTKAEISIWVIIPEMANHLIAQMIFMFEYNVRSGTVIGIVGAGGIGYYINLYLKFLQYEKVAAYLIIIFLVVMLIDLISSTCGHFSLMSQKTTSPHGRRFLTTKFRWTKRQNGRLISLQQILIAPPS